MTLIDIIFILYKLYVCELYYFIEVVLIYFSLFEVFFSAASMAALLVVIISLFIKALLGEIIFKEYTSNQVYYPTFIIEGLTGSCGLFVCETCIKLLTYTANEYESNQFYVEPNISIGHRYAWDYPNTAFVAPLSFEITLSNNEQITFSNIIPNWGTTRTFSTGKELCPTPSPTQPTNDPTPSPTNIPTISPSDNPSTPPTTSQSQ